MSIKKTFIIKEGPADPPFAGAQKALAAKHPEYQFTDKELDEPAKGPFGDPSNEGLTYAKKLAAEVIQACGLDKGCKGTLESALYDAWYLGKNDRYPPRSSGGEGF